jgi:hypothetical protein
MPHHTKSQTRPLRIVCPGFTSRGSFILHPGRSYHLEEAGYRVRSALDDD